MFRYKLKSIEAHKAWMKSPELLKNCSTGLHFPSEHLEDSEVSSVTLILIFSRGLLVSKLTLAASHPSLQEQVMPLKSLPFFAAEL
jgi:hypothetical protein